MPNELQRDLPRILEVDPQTLQAWLAAGEAVLVDVRERDEHAGERIPGSVCRPLSTFDPALLPTRPGKKIVLHCRSGQRSREAARHLIGAGAPEALHLAGGLQAWSAAGLEVQRSARAPIAVMRQVQLVAGGGVLAFTLLGVFVSPWFLAGCAFMGAGQIFAGLSGTCAMASLLGRMPWNRIEGMG